MPQVSLSPVFNETQYFDENGFPLANGQIYTYEGGGSTPAETYTSIYGDTANPNPIVLDASGRSPTAIWLINGNEYNFVLTKEDGTTVLSSTDNVIAPQVSNITGQVGTVIWNLVEAAPVYIGSTQFRIDGTYAQEFAKGNRIQYAFNDGNFGYGTVVAVSVVEYVTRVTFIPDSINFNNTVNAVYWSAAVTPNYIVDAGAVGYNSVLGYTGNNVGTQIGLIKDLIANWNRTYPTTGVSPSYTVTTSIPLDSYNNLAINIKFTNPSDSVPVTININGIGAKNIKQYDSTGNLIDPIIVTNMMSQILYNGTEFVLATPIPQVASGTIVWFGKDTAPRGWFPCDGSLLSTTAYPNLFAVIGYTFGGSGTSFNVPNLRGQFIRGYDGSVLPAPYPIGTKQFGSIGNHVHGVGYESNDNNGYFLQASRSYDTTGLTGYINWNGSGGGTGGGSVTNPMTFNLSTTYNQQLYDGGEVRPDNVTLLPCIKL